MTIFQLLSSRSALLLLAIAVLLHSPSANAEDVLDPDDVDLFEELEFETTILTADPGPNPDKDTAGAASVLGQDPVWWDLMQKSFSAKSNLQKCYKRGDTPPTHGSTCSERRKSCLFGTQTCPGGAKFPKLYCMCKHGVWSCEYHNCPQCPRNAPPPGTVDADLDGEDEMMPCPAEEGLTCSYNTQQCCGNLYPDEICTCEAGGTAECDSVDACLSPVCLINEWSAFVGTKTCDEATDLILEEYPGMAVECTTDTSMTLLAMKDEDINLNRVFIVTDGNDIVIEIPKVG